MRQAGTQGSPWTRPWDRPRTVVPTVGASHGRCMVLLSERSPEVRPRTPRLVVAVAVVLFPYVSMDPDRSRIPVSTDLDYTALVVHVFTASAALLVGVMQLVP